MKLLITKQYLNTLTPRVEIMSFSRKDIARLFDIPESLLIKDSEIDKGKAIIIGTGPSLTDQKPHIERLQRQGFKLFGVNNTYMDFDLDVWIACDPKWHKLCSPVLGHFDKWHWDKSICDRYGYEHIAGIWEDGLSTDKSYIHYGHSSGYQALNLAVHYGASEIYLAGYDMSYKVPKRHYFSGLSGQDGEYPKPLRKHSTFDGLVKCYETIAKQKGLPKIYNATRDSALSCFEFKYLEDL